MLTSQFAISIGHALGLKMHGLLSQMCFSIWIRDSNPLHYSYFSYKTKLISCVACDVELQTFDELKVFSMNLRMHTYKHTQTMV